MGDCGSALFAFLALLDISQRMRVPNQAWRESILTYLDAVEDRQFSKVRSWFERGLVLGGWGIGGEVGCYLQTRKGSSKLGSGL